MIWIITILNNNTEEIQNIIKRKTPSKNEYNFSLGLYNYIIFDEADLKEIKYSEGLMSKNGIIFIKKEYFKVFENILKGIITEKIEKNTFPAVYKIDNYNSFENLFVSTESENEEVNSILANLKYFINLFAKTNLTLDSGIQEILIYSDNGIVNKTKEEGMSVIKTLTTKLSEYVLMDQDYRFINGVSLTDEQSNRIKHGLNYLNLFFDNIFKINQKIDYKSIKFILIYNEPVIISENIIINMNEDQIKLFFFGLSDYLKDTIGTIINYFYFKKNPKNDFILTNMEFKKSTPEAYYNNLHIIFLAFWDRMNKINLKDINKIIIETEELTYSIWKVNQSTKRPAYLALVTENR